jgi:drug/metabolite transporter (DMT)-like permease|tara:strand:+ start:3213 stop:4295 length:1083 start_codon:yes stop_codon:yes gene_type:complete
MSDMRVGSGTGFGGNGFTRDTVSVGTNVYIHASSSENALNSSGGSIGVLLAVTSSLAIGASFIIKKKGLRRASSHGQRSAGSGGFGYLKEPLWWLGMVSLIVGELFNFAAYAFAPAVIVTPLGALSIIVAAVLSHYLLDEKLNPFGWLGCLLCIVGSVVIVTHAPEELEVTGVSELKRLASQTGFVCYVVTALGAAVFLALKVAPHHGEKHLVVPIAICSLIGSLSVMSVKALGIALRLTFQGNDQLSNPNTWLCVAIVVPCVITQMNYLNKALDVFNAAVVTPVYYVGFTTCTLTASSVMFKDWQRQTHVELLNQLCGFVTILSGVFVLHVTKDVDKGGLGAPGSARKVRIPQTEMLDR